MAEKKKENVEQTTENKAVRKAAEKKFEEIELFKDNKDYKDDVFVCVNGKNIVVKRGGKVKIEKKYADVLRNSLRQDAKTAELMERKQEEYREESRKRNL